MFYVSSASDVTVELAGEGNDTIRSAVDLTMGDFVETMIYTGSANWTATGNAQANWIYGGAGNDTLTGLAGEDYLKGGNGADSLYGGNDGDFLHGDDGDDGLYGGAGADRLFGGAGNDLMAGGSDDDTYYVTEAGDGVTELAGEGIDTVFTTVDYALGAAVERMTYSGAGNWTGTGSADDNVITGAGGNDTVYGGEGIDQLFGSGGQDML